MDNNRYIKMFCELDGECHGVVLFFFSEEQKISVLSQIKELSKNYTFTPRVTICKSNNRGEIHIDFHKNAHHEGIFFLEELIQSLNIESCSPKR